MDHFGKYPFEEVALGFDVSTLETLSIKVCV